MTREERLRATDMGHYFRIAPDGQSLNYDQFYVEGQVQTEGDEAYTSYNTNWLDVGWCRREDPDYGLCERGARGASSRGGGIRL